MYGIPEHIGMFWTQAVSTPERASRVATPLDNSHNMGNFRKAIS